MIIWISSYPKSENTWVRSIISSLVHSESGIFHFNQLTNIPQFPDEKYFQEFTNNFRDINQIKKYWIIAQDKINLDNKIKFFKTHHINCKIGKDNFTNKENTKATIYVVRDPRNLISSISNHYSKTIEESFDFLTTPSLIGGKQAVEFFLQSNLSRPLLREIWNVSNVRPDNQLDLERFCVAMRLIAGSSKMDFL